MRASISLHNIAKIEIEKKSFKLDTGTYVKHIKITDENGIALDISLFSDNQNSLKVIKEN